MSYEEYYPICRDCDRQDECRINEVLEANVSKAKEVDREAKGKLGFEVTTEIHVIECERYKPTF